ncbi:Zona pellucida-like domain containing protein [Ditylenchus destructor]|nr:Zona pellucida-like domain containing protein [Ditylenchus destructor]
MIAQTERYAGSSPIIECEREFIKFKVPTKQPFKGKVYVKGEFNAPECVHSYSDETDNVVTKTSQKSSKSTSRSASRENSSRNVPNAAESDRMGLSVERFDGDKSTTSNYRNGDKSRSSNSGHQSGRSENAKTIGNSQSYGRSESVESQSGGSENKKVPEATEIPETLTKQMRPLLCDNVAKCFKFCVHILSKNTAKI